MSRCFKAKVVSNFSLNIKTSLLTINPLEPTLKPFPGQFYMLGIGNSLDPLLKRPFSIFRNTLEGLQFLYEIRGRGTRMMNDLKPDTVIHILGPLGKGYPKPNGGRTLLLIAGGIGIASIFSLAETFGKRAYVFYGARDRDSLIMLDPLRSFTDELFISTDDGSEGKKGTVIDALDDFLNRHPSLIANHLLYACGPRPMLVALSRVANKRRMKGYVSVEENMACGFGACLGCAIKVKSKRAKDLNSSPTYKMVCKEGPVFSIEEIVW